jgi:hypothetical protein
MRYLLLIALAITFGTLMWMRRDQSHRLYGTWVAESPEQGMQMAFLDNGKCQMTVDDQVVYSGDYAFRGSTLQIIGEDGWQSLVDPIWDGDNTMSIQFIKWPEPVRFRRSENP